MTPEEHWLTSMSGSGMMESHESWLEKQEGSRKVSLLVIAHARQVWQSIIVADLGDYSWDYRPGSRRSAIDRCAIAIDVCDRFLAEQVSIEERTAALEEMEECDRSNHGPFLSLPLGTASNYALCAFRGESIVCYCLNGERLEENEVYLAILLRDIFGNWFRPSTVVPEWQTNTVRAIARQMYESRDFSAMPILADALQDAGCDNGDILNHCRDTNGVHVRGCWVVDAVLGL